MPPSEQDRGLSPRVRGSPICQTVRCARRGSIPAGAGEPFGSASLACQEWVYPRGCGGAADSESADAAEWGLSPRVRGSRTSFGCSPAKMGSIPAGAGEPTCVVMMFPLVWVYPRGCGGAHPRTLRQTGLAGLSPRVRGSPSPLDKCAVERGSIPAGAGEPCHDKPCTNTAGVYPRGCGGAMGALVRYHGGKGSIPAGAGEPMPIKWLRSPRRVYPRGCGEAKPPLSVSCRNVGLSPRVRGSRGQSITIMDASGSIPAGAGEPSAAGPTPVTVKVYPRGCGGARRVTFLPVHQQGLSPRVRGSQLQFYPTPRAVGSIPAGAGEPRRQRNAVP